MLKIIEVENSQFDHTLFLKNKNSYGEIKNYYH